jgi:hypothetical protein
VWSSGSATRVRPPRRSGRLPKSRPAAARCTSRTHSVRTSPRDLLGRPTHGRRHHPPAARLILEGALSTARMTVPDLEISARLPLGPRHLPCSTRPDTRTCSSSATVDGAACPPDCTGRHRPCRRPLTLPRRHHPTPSAPTWPLVWTAPAALGLYRLSPAPPRSACLLTRPAARRSSRCRPGRGGSGRRPRARAGSTGASG